MGKLNGRATREFLIKRASRRCSVNLSGSRRPVWVVTYSLEHELHLMQQIREEYGMEGWKGMGKEMQSGDLCGEGDRAVGQSIS